MTDQAHVPTDQETILYDAMTVGDWDTVNEMELDAALAPPDPDREAGELTAAEQYDVDYGHAHAHYQADHEAPEAERIENTADTVQDENLTA